LFGQAKSEAFLGLALALLFEIYEVAGLDD